MLEIKRKPNTPGGRATSTPTTSTLNEAGVGPFNDHYSIELATIHGVAPLPTPSVASRKHPPLIAPRLNDLKDYQTTLPVIREAQCKGSLNLDGIASGQLGGSWGEFERAAKG